MVLKKLANVLVTTAVIACLLFLVACDDDGSSSPVTPSDNDVSSSSIATANSSSSVVEESSSSVDAAKSSSSVKKESSSSVATANSSSSAVEESSSSIDSAKSSSSVTQSSSSSDISVIEESSSSIALENSSSSLMSSSSVIPSSSGESSSSAGEAASSSSSVELNCSALLEDEFGWDWNIPKECRFNPNITYGTMTDSRDKKVYKTIKIGAQTWMAENLNYFDKALNDRSWCFGASDSTTTANCAVAGRLYTWAAAIDSAKLYNDKSIDCGHRKTCTLPDTVYGVCPPGWHLPTRAEWDALITEVGGSDAGKVLKSQTGWFDNYGGTDDVGFTGLPVGIRNYDGDAFDDDAFETRFWSATEYSSYGAYYMDLFTSDDASVNTGNKHYGFSVRCLQN